MSEIKIEHQPDQQRLEQPGVYSWGVWEKQASESPWTHDSEETCYFLAGELLVTTENGMQYAMRKGDLVTFPRGLSCTWLIMQDVRKHFTFT